MGRPAKRVSFNRNRNGTRDTTRSRHVGLPVIPEEVKCAEFPTSNESAATSVRTNNSYDEDDLSVAPPDDDYCLSSVEDDDSYFYIPPGSEQKSVHDMVYVPRTETEREERRMAVKFFYHRVYGAPPPSEWRSLGLVQKIARHVMTNRGGEKSVRNIMEDVYCCIMTDAAYEGKRRSPIDSKRKVIPDNSEEMQFIVDHIEQGLGLRFTTHLLNCNRLEEGKKPVGRTAVYNAMKRCKPVITAVKSIPQGSAKKSSDWAKARLNWTTQVLIRLGKLPVEMLESLKNEKGELPAFFDKKKLTCFDPEQVAFFDEMHKKQLIGNINKTDVRFYRDENGKLDLKNGKLRDPRPRLKAKFHKEARMVLGVAIDKDGEGCRLPLYDYTQKHVCYIGEWEELVAKEIKRVKNLKNKKGPWFVKKRIDGVLYSGDPVGKLPNIGNTYEQKLQLEDVVTISDLFLHPNPSELLYKVGLRGEKLDQVIDCENDIEMGPPMDIDHHLAENPYKSLYGDDWETKIKSCSNLSPYVCITEIIKHIIKACKNHFRFTKYKNKWYFHHDALKQMTDQKCIDWMEEEGYLQHWVLPEQKLNQEFKRYYGRPVGNSPEFMPLDTCLIKDLSGAVRRHAAITHKLAADNDKKFDMSTPQRLMHCYERIWNNPTVQSVDSDVVLGGVPSSDRIKTDFYKVFDSMLRVFKAEGAIVANCGTQSGKRARLVPDNMKSQRGGWKIKMQSMEFYWTHPDAADALSEIMTRKQRTGPMDDDMIVDNVPEIEQCEKDDIQLDCD